MVYLEVQGGQYRQVMTRSFDGGVTFDTPRNIANVTSIGVTEPLLGSNSFINKAFSGRSGGRVTPLPNMDIANGAPTGTNATNAIAIAWSDGSAGLNNEDSVVILSTDGGNTFSTKQVISDTADRSMMTGVALSPDGESLYLTYNAFLTNFQNTTANARQYLGVVRHADLSGTTLSNLQTLHRGQTGDSRASARNNSLQVEFLGDYIGISATNLGATAVFMDGRRSVTCTAMNTYRQKRINGQSATVPSPNTVCPAGFGNTDIFAAPVLEPLF